MRGGKSTRVRSGKARKGRALDPSTKMIVAATALGMCVGAVASKSPNANRAGIDRPAAKDTQPATDRTSRRRR